MKVVPGDVCFPAQMWREGSVRNKSIQSDVLHRLGEPVCEAGGFHCVLPHAASSGKTMKGGLAV